jgi:hypothetical protein
LLATSWLRRLGSLSSQSLAVESRNAFKLRGARNRKRKSTGM